jgi:hypothetical protein
LRLVLQVTTLSKFGNSGGVRATRDLVPQQQIVGVYTPTPTEQTYDPLVAAFRFFNHRLFAGVLPDCLITLQRKANTLGYFSPGKFAAIDGDALVDEIALNPMAFRGCTPKDVASTLAHEMAHAWQHHFGKSPRAGYHDREWAAVMRSIGLQPSSTGVPGGAETGYKVSHYIIDGGPFDLAYTAFEAAGQDSLRWGDAFQPNDEKRKPKRLTFVCSRCDQKVQGVWSTRVRCDLCNLIMVVRGKGDTAAAATAVDNIDAGSVSVGAGGEQ